MLRVLLVVLVIFAVARGLTVQTAPGVLVVELPKPCETRCTVRINQHRYRETIYRSTNRTDYAALPIVRPAKLDLCVPSLHVSRAWVERGAVWVRVQRELDERIVLTRPDQRINFAYFNTTVRRATMTVLTRGIDVTVVIDGKHHLYVPSLMRVALDQGEHLVEWRWILNKRTTIDRTRGDGFTEPVQMAVWWTSTTRSLKKNNRTTGFKTQHRISSFKVGLLVPVVK